MSIVIELLNKNHTTSSFDCGVKILNSYLEKQATQDIKRKIAQVYVARDSSCLKNILGYYTLNSLSIELNELPENMARKLPKYSIPSALIGRLAVHVKNQKHGIGKILLADATKRTLFISKEIVIYAIVVDAQNVSAQQFYQKYGFLKLNTKGLRLFLPVKSLL